MPVLSTLGGASAFGFGLNRLAAAIGALTDQYWANTVLLLNADGASDGGQNNTFRDVSGNGHSITRNGNVTQGSFSPFSVDDGKWGVYFDGTTDYVRSPTTSDFNLSTNDFCYEGWIWAEDPDAVSYPRFFGLGPYYQNVNSFGVFIADTDNSDYITTYWNDGTLGRKLISSSTLAANQWNHIAVVRSGSNFGLFLNGTRIATYTSSAAIGSGNNYAFVGHTGTGTEGYVGYFSNVRLVNGSSVYDPTQTTITVPTSPLTDVTNTKLLVGQSNRFVDNSSVDNSLTLTGTPKVVPFSPFPKTTAYTQSVVNQGSVKFDASTDKLTFTDTANDLDLGGTQASFECWYYPVALGAYQNMLVKYGGSIAWNTTTGIEYAISLNNGVFRIGYNDGDSSPSAVEDPTTRTAGQWYHFAVATDASNNIALFVNGTRVATGTNAITKPTTRTSIEIGSTNNEFLNGYLSNVRFITGSGAIDPTVTSFTVPTEPLTDIANTSLLTCQASGFVDNSSNAHTITVNGNPERTTNVPFGERSVEFDGSGDELITSGASIGDFGTGDFTIEAWVNPDLLSGYNSIIADDTYSSGSTPNAWCLYLDGTSLDGWKGGSSILTGGTLKVGQWHHVAWTRSSGTMYLFLDGVQVATASDSTSFNYGDIIVGSNVGNYHIEGYLSNVRIVKGTAVYTTDFTPPTEPLTAITNTSLLTCQNAVFQDNSGNAHAITANGNPQASTNLPFGERSVYFDGSGDYLTFPEPTLSGDFTLETWVQPTSLTGTRLLFSSSSQSNVQIPRIQTNGGVYVYINGTQLNAGSTATALANTNEWHHFALTRSGTTVYAFVDGEEIWNTTFSSSFKVGVLGAFFLSGSLYTTNPYYFGGYASNTRIVNGTALYTAAFTPPTEPLTAVSGTSLLTCQDAVFQDNSGNAHAITVNGNAEASTNIPFAPVTTYGVQQYLDDAFTVSPQGGSGYFDGTGDYLNSSASMTIPTNGDFTIECWVYATTQTNQGVIQLSTTNSIADFDIFISMYPNLEFQWGYSSGNNYVSTTGSKFPIRTWLHVAMVRNSGTTKLYINGVDSGGTVSSTTAYTITNMFVGSYYSTSNLFNGYISDARVINGTALYTSNFTPPTAPLTPVSGTSLLLNFTNASIIDATGRNVIETVGNAQVDTTTVKYGTGAMEFDGTGDGLIAPNSEAFDFGSGDFTLEAWVYMTTTSHTHHIFSKRTSGGASNTNWILEIVSGNYDFYASDGSSYIVSSLGNAAGTINTWQHIAITRSGNDFKMFLDGTQAGSTITTSSAISSTARDLNIGLDPAASNNRMEGYIDDLRITKGIARYTANFTPPTAELPVVGQ